VKLNYKMRQEMSDAMMKYNNPPDTCSLSGLFTYDSIMSNITRIQESFGPKRFGYLNK